MYLLGTIVCILNWQFPFPLLRDTAYAAVEPCRRQRPERSEDAAREQAAEGRPAKRFRPDKNKEPKGHGKALLRENLKYGKNRL